MIITTKFDVGDRVFVMNGNQVTEGSIIKIEISHYTGEKKKANKPLVINYDIKISKDRSIWGKKEEECFATKQELIKSL